MTTTTHAAPGSAETFKAAVFENAAGETIPYRLLVPEITDPSARYPLVLFLHGFGESGTDNIRQLRHSVGAFEKIQDEFPCFVVVPQCPEKGRDEPWGWADMHPRDLMMNQPRPERIGRPLRLVIELLRSIKERFPVDENRLYVAGISMGGFGTWELLAREPDMFAAAVPICGGGDPRAAQALCKTPVWAFHGAEDTVVIPEFSRRTIDAIREAGGDPRYSELPEVGHQVWDPAFATPELLPWVFKQRRDSTDH